MTTVYVVAQAQENNLLECYDYNVLPQKTPEEAINEYVDYNGFAELYDCSLFKITIEKVGDIVQPDVPFKIDYLNKLTGGV